jgi:hypothetical protein
MRPFELEAARRLLFFSPREAAVMVSHTSEQAWRRWESGARKVPDDVAQRVNALLKWRQSAVDVTINQMSATPKDASIALIWYDSLDSWATLPGREPALWRPQQSVCAAVLAEFPGRLHLVRFDAPAYSVWLAGRQDSETMRGCWAGTVVGVL